MGDAPYRRRHENLAGVDVSNNPPLQFFTKGTIKNCEGNPNLFLRM
jgi:hypothetical protein